MWEVDIGVNSGQFLVNSGQFSGNLIETSGNLIETSYIPSYIPVFTRIYPYLPVFTRTPRIPLCSHTPRFSYGTLRTAVYCVSTGTHGAGREGVPGWGMGPGGYREGLYRVLPSQLLEERTTDSEAGPGSPARAGVGGQWCSDAHSGPSTTLRARSGTRALPVLGPPFPGQ